MSSVFYVNGEFVTENEAHIPTDERGHQFGDGVYEVVRVYGGRPFLLPWHLERLQRSCDGIGLTNPHTQGEWTQIIGEAVRRSGEAEATVYWQVTRGIAARSHLFPQVQPSVTLSVRPVGSGPSQKSGKVLCYPDERWSNAWVKSINLLPNVMAKEVAHRVGASEALLVREGDITEGCSSNAWFVKGHEVFTAPANRYILGGITRRFVLQLVKDLGYNVAEQTVTLDEIRDMDEAFVTSTTLEILGVEAVLVDAKREALLYDLPDVPSPSLMRMPEALETLWTSATHAVVPRLQAAFAQKVEQFRNYEEPVVSE